MRTFRETPRRIDHWTEQEFLALVAAVSRLRYQNEHYRSLFATFLELDWCTSARLGSLRTEELTVGDVDWQNGVLRLRRVKNVERHDVVLTDRAIAQLRKHVEMLAATPQWKGDATPLFVSSRGEMVSHTFFHNKLRRAAAAAGVQKAIFPHAIRKSAGTLIARENPKLAQEQLGITDRIFNRHYNQPLLEDRIARRDILPGAGGRRDASPEARVGKAFMDLQAGRISQGEFDAEIRRAQLHGADPKRTDADPSVA